MAVQDKASVQRVVEAGGRNASALETGLVRVLVDDAGGMVPVFSALMDRSAVNAHWTPHFRSNSGAHWNDKKHGGYWRNALLYHIAGNFPCVPSFGGAHLLEGEPMPPHGWSAVNEWRFEKMGVDEESGAAWARARLSGAGCGLDLTLSKIDAVIPGSPVHYTSLQVKNNGGDPAQINAAWHNTVGQPFLQEGCRISASAMRWMTAPPAGEWDMTSRLALGADFVSLSKAPLAIGGRCDISGVPGIIGHTDFVTGAVPEGAPLGWSAVVNTAQKLVYLTFFTGPAAAADDDIILYFNDLWMQYGGRPYTPWALYDGGTDLNFCLGLENAVAAFSNGLAYARHAKELLGNPTTVTIMPHGVKTLRYGSLFAPYENNILDDGITAVEAAEGALVCIKSGSWRFPADPAFATLKKLEKIHDD